MTGSHSRLGISDRESRTTGVIRAYDTVFRAGRGFLKRCCAVEKEDASKIVRIQYVLWQYCLMMIFIGCCLCLLHLHLEKKH